jgi:hypothetical protein
MLQRYREAAGANTTSSTLLAEAGDELLPPSSYLPLAVNEKESICGKPPGKGSEGKNGWDVVIKVVLDGPNPLPLPSSESRPTSDKIVGARNIIECWIEFLDRSCVCAVVSFAILASTVLPLEYQVELIQNTGLIFPAFVLASLQGCCSHCGTKPNGRNQVQLPRRSRWNQS